jgi:glycosyltransferase involved in cell wall biosynthesis
LFIFPSFLEGFGMPPLEALACGTPVVVADASALKENLAGIAPLINPPDRVEGYLEVINDILAGKNVVNWKAAEKLLERFSIESFGERVRACLQEKMG